MPAVFRSSWNFANDPNADSMALARSPAVSPPPSGLMFSQNIPLLKCPPPLLRAAVVALGVPLQPLLLDRDALLDQLVGQLWVLVAEIRAHAVEVRVHQRLEERVALGGPARHARSVARSRRRSKGCSEARYLRHG